MAQWTFLTLTCGNKNVSFDVVLGIGRTPCSLLFGFSKQAGKSIFVCSWFPIFKNRDWLIFIFKFCQNLVTGSLSKNTPKIITSLKHTSTCKNLCQTYRGTSRTVFFMKSWKCLPISWSSRCQAFKTSLRLTR